MAEEEDDFQQERRRETMDMRVRTFLAAGGWPVMASWAARDFRDIMASMTNGQQYILMVNVPTLQVFNDTAPITVNNASSPGSRFLVPPTLGAGNGSSFGSNNMYGGVDMVFDVAPVVPRNFFFR